MVADVLDDAEDVHVDKAGFRVALVAVQTLDVLVAEFDFQTAQLPGDGSHFAGLVGIVVDEAVQRGDDGVMGFAVHARKLGHGLSRKVVGPVLAICVVFEQLLAVVADALDVPRTGDVLGQGKGRVVGNARLHDVFGVGLDGLVQMVELGFGFFDVGDEFLPVAEEHFLYGVKQMDGDEAHVGAFVLDRFHGDAGSGLDELGIEILGPFHGLVGLVGQDFADKRRKRLDEGQEDACVEDVEQRVGVGNLVPDAVGGHGDQLLVHRQDAQEDAHADDVEKHMGGTGLLGGPVRPDGREYRGDGRADVVAEDDGDGRVERQKPLKAKGDGQAHRSGARLDEQGEQGAGENPHKGVVAEHQEEFFFVAQEAHGGFHGLHAHEEQTESEESASGVLLHLGASEEGEQNAYYNEEVGIILYLDGEYLAGDGGPDIRAHDDADGLRERHESRVDEADRHDGGGAAALDEDCDAGSHENAHDGRFGQRSDKLPQSVPGYQLESLTDQLDGEEEKPDAAKKLNEALYRHEDAP